MLADLSYTTERPNPYNWKQRLQRGARRRARKGRGWVVDSLFFDCGGKN